jgi:hypothetical protein
MLGLWSSAVMKHPEDGTFVPKHVAVGTLHEVYFVIPVLLYIAEHILLVDTVNVRKYTT